MSRGKIIIVAGPTASGKTSLAVKIAEYKCGVVINADSKQVYQDVPIITAQPTEDEKKSIDHQLYGVIPISSNYTAANWVSDASVAINNIQSQGKLAILVGGTGMYIKSLVSGLSAIPDISSYIRQEVRKLYDSIGKESFYKLLLSMDEAAKKKILSTDKQRMIRAMEVLEGTGKSLYYWHGQKSIAYYKASDFLFIYVTPPRELIYKKVNSRFSKMLEDGAIEEVRVIMNTISDRSLPIYKAHGVPELVKFLENKIGLDEASMLGQANTRKYVKRQTTWFNHQLSDIKTIKYRDEDDFEDVISFIDNNV